MPRLAHDLHRVAVMNRIRTYLSLTSTERLERAQETILFCDAIERMLAESSPPADRVGLVRMRWAALSILKMDAPSKPRVL